MNDHLKIKDLKCKENVFLLSNCGNKIVWFSLGIPNGLKQGEKLKKVREVEIPLPYTNYCTINSDLSGWMSYWQHFGPRCEEATAFIIISPLNSRKPIVEIHCYNSDLEDILIDDFRYDIREEYLNAFCDGLTKGLQTVNCDPLCDIKIQVLNFVEHEVDSNGRSYVNLGQWLIERMTVEMYKKGILKTM